MHDKAQRLQNKALEEINDQTEPEESAEVMDIDDQREKLGLSDHRKIKKEAELGPSEIDSAKQDKVNKEDELED